MSTCCLLLKNNGIHYLTEYEHLYYFQEFQIFHHYREDTHQNQYKLDRNVLSM